MAAITAIEKGSGNEAEVEVVEIGFFCPNDYAGPPVGIRRGGACSFIRRIKRLPTAIWERGLDALDEILGCARRNRSINVASGRDFHPARPVRPFGGLLTSRVEMLLVLISKLINETSRDDRLAVKSITPCLATLTTCLH